MTEITPPVWKKNDLAEYYDGAVYLFALQVGSEGREQWEYHKLRISCDSETQAELYCVETDEYFSDWSLEDFEFYIQISE